MKWSEQTWKEIDSHYQSILQLPFITELSQGILPEEKFCFYMAQDSLYLEHYGRTLSLIGTKIPDIQDALAFIRFAESAIVVEHALHESYFKDFGIITKGTMQPACHHYVHFLKSTAALEPVEIAIAAVLPCFWIYKKAGDHIYNNRLTENNRYQRWIDTYKSDEFGESVKHVINICDKIAADTTSEKRREMTEAFIMSSRMEYYFWEAAYTLNTWQEI